MCDKCGKPFTEKRNLTRHMKTHGHSHTYSCNICGKEFTRPDNKKRHEESRNYTITCPVGDQYFNRKESMLCHRALHERPEVRPRMLVKRPASPGPSNSPAKVPGIHSPQFSNSPSVEPNILPEEPETRILYLRHWNTIQTQENSGNRVQDRYNFTLNDIASSTFPEMVHQIFRQQTSAFKINVFYFEKRRNWKTTLLPFQPEQLQICWCSTPHQNWRRSRTISGRLEPSRHIGVYSSTVPGYEMGCPFADQCDVLCQQAVWPPNWCQSRPSRSYFEEQSCRWLSWWIPWTLYRQPMLFLLFSSKSWSTRCQSFRNPNQDVLQTVSTTIHDPCRLQGCDVGLFCGIGAGIQLERVCVWLTRNRNW